MLCAVDIGLENLKRPYMVRGKNCNKKIPQEILEVSLNVLEPDGSLTGDIKALFSFFFLFFSPLDFVLGERKKMEECESAKGLGGRDR